MTDRVGTGARASRVDIAAEALRQRYREEGYFEPRIQPVLEHCLANRPVVNLALTDTVDNAETLRQTLALCKQHGARFVTLTQFASM